MVRPAKNDNTKPTRALRCQSPLFFKMIQVAVTSIEIWRLGTVQGSTLPEPTLQQNGQISCDIHQDLQVRNRLWPEVARVHSGAK